LFDKWTNLLAQLENLNWNSSQLLQEDHITANLILNYSINLLNYLKIIELLDNFVYLILCHETIRDFEIVLLFKSFFEAELCVLKIPCRVSITALAFVFGKRGSQKSCKCEFSKRI
jgi:hypothetical protein